MNLIQRATAPTPKLFKKIRNIGVVMAAVSAAILASPVALPVILIKAAGYLAVAGSVASAVSQVTVSDQTQKENDESAN